MTHLRSIRNIAIAATAAVVTLAATNAQAGNYQDHVLPNTTRHTVSSQQFSSEDTAQHIVRAEAPVIGGSYQDHVLPSTTRRTGHIQVGTQGQTASHEVAMSGHGQRR